MIKRAGEEGLVDVERWAELRREHFVRGVSIKELVRRTGLSKNTVRRALRAGQPPIYRRAPTGSKLDPFKDEVHRLLAEDPKLPGQRVRELIEELGFDGGKTIVDDYLREVRPLFARPRVFQRTTYRPGELLQFDLWEPRDEIPVGHGQTRKGYVVICCLGYSRVGAGVLVFSKRTPDLLAGIAGCLSRIGGLPETVVWDRQAGIHAHAGRPTGEFAAFCGQLKLDWRFCEGADPQAKGVVERLQGYAETNFEPGRRFAGALDYQLQLDAWLEKANRRAHRSLRWRPADRLDAERLRPLPQPMLDSAERFVVRVPVQPYVRVDTCDYSLDPRLVSRRVEVSVSQREVTAICLDSGEIACAHERSFARHRTITALEHARALREHRGDRRAEPPVEVRPLERYDALIA